MSKIGILLLLLMLFTASPLLAQEYCSAQAPLEHAVIQWAYQNNPKHLVNEDYIAKYILYIEQTYLIGKTYASPETVVSIIAIETRWLASGERVISPTKDYGIMQIHRRSWFNKGPCKKDLLNGYENIDCGLWILKEIAERPYPGKSIIGYYNGGMTLIHSYARKVERVRSFLQQYL